MKIKLPQYTGKDYLVLGLVILPITLVINAVIFGSVYFKDFHFFWQATIISGVALTVDFILCGTVALRFKKRFPGNNQTGLKLSFMIITFLLITGLFLLLLFKGYEYINFRGYRFNENGFIWSYIGMGIINIFLTFLLEGIAHFEEWKKNIRETEHIRQLFKQSELQALRSQVNPHFLFNSLNSLSSLLTEDNDKAEMFLDEMSKLYRYLLRKDEEQLVPLREEIKFLRSYLFLLTTRFGEGLVVLETIALTDLEKQIAPLTLQIIIEDIISCNTISKNYPLRITISSGPSQTLIISHNLQAKNNLQACGNSQAMQHLSQKYQFLCCKEVQVKLAASVRVLTVPLLELQKEVVV
jgi:hypothetical protein